MCLRTGRLAPAVDCPFTQNSAHPLSSRKIESIDKEKLNNSCLLCSEDRPHHCHRRLVAEYLAGKWSNVEIVHL
ncbi:MULTISPECIES: DUF488 family protein [Cupriavidus]|uniref:DUF488 family protein n=1 Tax=Cupriavidus TaxID=106589 RepID=UPI001E3EA38B|nr:MULTISPECIES: DUF488 family protein [Cupriavidus]